MTEILIKLTRTIVLVIVLFCKEDSIITMSVPFWELFQFGRAEFVSLSHLAQKKQSHSLKNLFFKLLTSNLIFLNISYILSYVK